MDERKDRERERERTGIGTESEPRNCPLRDFNDPRRERGRGVAMPVDAFTFSSTRS